jgi:hypothetical protein
MRPKLNQRFWPLFLAGLSIKRLLDIITLAIMGKNAVPGLLAALYFDNFFNKILQLCPDLTKVCDNIFSNKGGNIMNTDQMKPKPMNEDQLENIKKQIIQTYLFLISHTGYDPKVVEIMKLSALADVQRRYEAGESW